MQSPLLNCSKCYKPFLVSASECPNCKTRRSTRTAEQTYKAQQSVDTSDSTIQQLKADLMGEVNATRKGWTGSGVTIQRFENPVSSSNKDLVRAEGNAYGCHTCGEPISANPDQPWIGDHIPPTKLKSDVLEAIDVDPKVQRVLFPQCDVCAATQSALVQKLNATPKVGLEAALKAMTAHESALIVGGLKTEVNVNCIASSGPTVSTAESQSIKALGQNHGCHSCSTKFPARIWHADHCPPISLHSPNVTPILAAMGISFARYEARPQCPKCSHSQGGRMARIEALLREAMRYCRFTSYK